MARVVKKLPAVLADRLYIPKSLVDPEDFETVLTHHMYDERQCRKCDNAPERFNAICAVCKSYKGSRTHYVETKLDGYKGKFVGLPIGGAPAFLKRLGVGRSRLDIADKRSVVRARRPLIFTGRLYNGEVVNGAKTAHQKDLVANLLKGLKEKRRGFCIVSPRAGKTVIAAKVACATKLRTLFIAADSALLDQFMDTLRQHTSFASDKKKTAAGIAHTPADFEKYDHIVCTTWQALMERHGTGRLDAIWDSFGLVIVDEVHLSSSPEYFAVINNINAKYFLGMTATLRRKDGSEVSSIATFGPVLAEEEVPALTPTVYALETKVSSKCKNFVNLVSELTRNSRRNALIVDTVFDILRKDPRRHVLVVSSRFSHITTLTGLINAKADATDEVADGRWNMPLAVAYHGKLSKTTTRKRPISPRQQVLADVKAGKYRVTVAQNTLVKYGVNVPRWTDIILTIPMSSKISPDPEYHQLSLRPCTPAPNKPKPGIYHLVDVNSMAEGCFSSSITKSAVVLNYDLDASVRRILQTRQTASASAAASQLQRKPW